MRLINRNLIGKPIHKEGVKKINGIFIPMNSDLVRYREVEVTNCDPDIKEINKGDIVYVFKHVGIEMDIEGEDCIIFNQRDIILSE